MPAIETAITIDSYLRDGLYVNTNYGTTDPCRVGRVSVRRGAERSNYVFQYDLSGHAIPAGAVITKADFTPTTAVFGEPGTDLPLTVSRLTESWAETKVTWLERTSGVNWTDQGGTHSTDDPVQETFTWPALVDCPVIDLITFVQDAIDNRSGLLNVKIWHDGTGNAIGLVQSGETSLLNLPKLEVTWVLPTNLLLIGNGVANGTRGSRP